jgi:hypothetical protein
VPRPVVNSVLLRFPQLYETRLIAYESHLTEVGLSELKGQLELVRNVPGDILECGSAHCGTSIVMARHLASRGIGKLILACDSFEGFDRAELARERDDGLVRQDISCNSFTSTSYAYVQRKLTVLGLGRAVIPIKGYFKDSLPKLHGPFALALIDCDLRDSLLFAAEDTWTKLSPGGRLVFDDYTNTGGAGGAKLGVDLFIQGHHDEIADQGLLERLYFAVKRE